MGEVALPQVGAPVEVARMERRDASTFDEHVQLSRVVYKRRRLAMLRVDLCDFLGAGAASF